MTLKITQETDADGCTIMTLEPALTGGLKGAPERRPLDWTQFEQNDTLFGLVRIRSRYIDGTVISDGQVRPLVELQIKDGGQDRESFLGGEFSIDTKHEVTGGIIKEAFLHDFVCSINCGWIAEQVCNHSLFAVRISTHGTLDLGSGKHWRRENFDTPDSGSEWQVYPDGSCRLQPSMIAMPAPVRLFNPLKMEYKACIFDTAVDLGNQSWGWSLACTCDNPDRCRRTSDNSLNSKIPLTSLLFFPTCPPIK
jgi:hypothetical protein